jgi:hypothetical protein
MQTERCIWQMLLRIASGSPAIEELPGFLRDFNSLEKVYDAPQMEFDWFAQCERYTAAKKNSFDKSMKCPLLRQTT